MEMGETALTALVSNVSLGGGDNVEDEGLGVGEEGFWCTDNGGREAAEDGGLVDGGSSEGDIDPSSSHHSPSLGEVFLEGVECGSSPSKLTGSPSWLGERLLTPHKLKLSTLSSY